ncbi:hypothetical protein [Hymenobacter coccineus]|uniref:Uncharacterized protein n=1 Tax=Hymenobacter coccineus TaxID=1908235 RepID=A0A1G1TLN9_9BACT|nr:hypothetical protein [Hymenobacter coccineus]OGX91770.1 hypothetical protein BEN49_18505 [Hymenobacter coccineus]
MTTAEFWDQQQFSYIVTYSFNRGPKLAALREATVVAIKQAKQELHRAWFMQQAGSLRKLRGLEADFSGNIPLKTPTDKKSATDNSVDQIAVIERVIGSGSVTQWGPAYSSW